MNMEMEIISWKIYIIIEFGFEIGRFKEQIKIY
jgi:hypothetical protein